MEVKMFEVRDRATCISVLAVRLGPTRKAERWLAARVGYGIHAHEQQQFVLLTDMVNLRTHHDPEFWGGITMPPAHKYIAEHWDDLPSGAVVDAEWCRGERDRPRVSDYSEDAH